MKIIVIGSGPAGLATADHLQTAGHQVVVFEKGPIAAAIANYPPYMTYFSTSNLLEIGDVPLTVPADKPTRREYLYYITRFVRSKKLDVRTYHQVEGADGQIGAFRVFGTSFAGDRFSEDCERIVVATGAYGTPQTIGIPGENLPKVSHYYKEPHPYVGQRVLVIGGRNSAIEAALEIWRNGAEVTLSYRRETFPDSVKYWVRPDIENRIKSGEIQAFIPSRVLAIEPTLARLEYQGRTITLPNDFVLALTGYQPDTAFLRCLGIRYDPETKRPAINPETFESNVPGIYIVGVIQAGNISSEIFIENSRHHGTVIVKALSGYTASRSSGS